ncbi:type IV pilus assembly protein PilN [Cupriavidus gilardii J11]|uniref:Type IV pilus assembly protein PilN n=1 Tax=Cupriavidus gilardii J11 TaxID=936133 RepID=A0A562BEC6_9BURK|nr:PilN domain-containing protein [Cupriavidus gilardii]TWG83471.1 type IV pilus assembly protein PilN [Cupriavidus gilardii J11]
MARTGAGPAPYWRDAAPCIDLLPHPGRDARRRRRRALVLVVASGTVAALLVWAGQLYLDRRIAAMANEHVALDGEIARLRSQASHAGRVASEVEALQDRLLALQRLEGARGFAARWLDALARQVPAGVYLTAVEQDGDTITIGGVAGSNEAIAGLIGQLPRVPGLGAAQLLESRANDDAAPGIVFKIGVSGAVQRPAGDGESGDGRR